MMQISIMYKGRKITVEHKTAEEVAKGLQRCQERVDLDTCIGPIAKERRDELRSNNDSCT